MSVADDLRAAIVDLLGESREDLARHVAIPSVANNPDYPVEHVKDSAELTVELLRAAGLGKPRTIKLDDGTFSAYGEAAGPRGAPTVLLYAHHDVQPPGDESAWAVGPWELSERKGRLYGRGAADCKGGLQALVLALKAFAGDFPVGVKVIVEGAEEANTGSFARFVPKNAKLLAADTIVVGDSGNLHKGNPNVITSLRGVANARIEVRTLQTGLHSGKFGGPAPDALMALVRALATLADERGGVAVEGVRAGSFSGFRYTERQFRKDAGLLEGVRLAGEGSVSDRLWAKPSVTVLGIDCPSVDASSATLIPYARARVGMRVAPGDDAERASRGLQRHLRRAVPGKAQVTVTPEAPAAPFAADTSHEAFRALRRAARTAYGKPLVPIGSGGAIGMVSALQATFRGVPIVVWGVQDGAALIHTEHESLDPKELERQAHAQALFLLELTKGGAK